MDDELVQEVSTASWKHFKMIEKCIVCGNCSPSIQNQGVFGKVKYPTSGISWQEESNNHDFTRTGFYIHSCSCKRSLYSRHINQNSEPLWFIHHLWLGNIIGGWIFHQGHKNITLYQEVYYNLLFFEKLTTLLRLAEYEHLFQMSEIDPWLLEIISDQHKTKEICSVICFLKLFIYAYAYYPYDLPDTVYWGRKML